MCKSIWQLYKPCQEEITSYDLTYELQLAFLPFKLGQLKILELVVNTCQTTSSYITILWDPALLLEIDSLVEELTMKASLNIELWCSYAKIPLVETQYTSFTPANTEIYQRLVALYNGCGSNELDRKMDNSLKTVFGYCWFCIITWEV